MADTIICFNENEKCQDCNENPVTIQHWGPITNNEFKKLCKSCFNKREEKINHERI